MHIDRARADARVSIVSVGIDYFLAKNTAEPSSLEAVFQLDKPRIVKRVPEKWDKGLMPLFRDS